MPILLIVILIVSIMLFMPKKIANIPTDKVIAKQAEVIDNINDVVQAEKNPITYAPMDILDNPMDREFFTTNPEVAEHTLQWAKKQYTKIIVDESQNKYKYVFIATNSEYADIYNYFESVLRPV